MPNSNSNPTPSTSRHPPSDLAPLSSTSRLRLEVLDVTSTAVALSVSTPPPPSTSSDPSPTTPTPTPTPPRSKTTAGSMFRKRAPVISIQLDGQPWPHVAHAGGLSQEGVREGGRSAETTVIVYGLVPGREYEISLDVTTAGEGEETETEHFNLDVETGQEGKQPLAI